MKKYVYKNKLNIFVIGIIDFLGNLFFRPFIKKDGITNINKILVVRLDHIGDVIFSTTVFEGLRKQFPSAKIMMMAGSWAKEIVQFNPNIDEVIVFDAPWFCRTRQRNKLKNIFQIIRKLRSEKFDLAFELRGDFRNIILLFFSRIKYRVGYGITGGGFLLNKMIEYGKEKHEIEYNLGQLHSLNFPVYNKSLDIFVPSADDCYMEDLLKSNNVIHGDKLVGIHTGSGTGATRWPLDNYRKLTERLIRELNLKIVLTGGSNEKYHVEKLINEVSQQVLNFCGKTTLLQLTALWKKCLMVIGSNSGPVHLAAAVGTPIIMIYGGTNSPKRWGPLCSNSIVIQKNVNCMYCEKKECTDLRCMKLITIDEVFEAVKTVINRRVTTNDK